MSLINLRTLPGLGRSNGTPGFADFPKFPEFPELPAAGLEGGFDAAPGSPEATGTAGTHFAEILEEAINSVSHQDHKADAIALDASTGGNVDPHTVMIEMAKAETMIHLTSSISTKMAQNVQTIMNMQI
ncbi:MAG: flagellar hook-basal body complex protein FliE [Candidatus Sericytochromatia bacterium]|nr:flagellar hook-basal body complex protein FliE [Candidatus Tanganyikabacteria bacterium]